MAEETLLFHLSDIHFGLEHNRALDWVAAEIAARKPAAVAITGDLTMRARHSEFAAAKDWILSLDAPVTPAGGQPVFQSVPADMLKSLSEWMNQNRPANYATATERGRSDPASAN